MGWKGAVRSIRAAYRRAERDARRRQRELERQLKELEKQEELERAALEVDAYENHIDLISSVHRECGEAMDWESLSRASEPPAPTRTSTLEREAQDALFSYAPGFFDRLFGRAESRRDELRSRLLKAKQYEEAAHKKAMDDWSSEHRSWERECELAIRVLANEPESKIEAIKIFEPFSEIAELGSKLLLSTSSSGILEATLYVHGNDVIPKMTKSLLKSGRLSVKEMPKGRFNELFQDYVCSCVLRVANEVFALLSTDSVLVNAYDKILNTKNGHLEEAPILSVFIPSSTLSTLNMDRIDPSDSMGNFVHNMDFKKTRGFSAIQVLDPKQF